MLEKTLGNTDVNGARKSVADLVVFGDGDAFQLICKASSQAEGWGIGCVVQVTTHQRNHDGTNSVAEALCFVPGAKIRTLAGGGRELIAAVGPGQ